MEGWLGPMTAILTIIIGSGGIAKFVVEPWLKERNNRLQFATAFALSCRELRLHLSEIKKKCEQDGNQDGNQDNDTKKALRKIPDWDFMKGGNKAAWFTENGYLCMITAYKIAHVSSLVRLYQVCLKNAYLRKTRTLMAELYNRFDKFKTVASTDTILWYYYIDAIGDKLIINMGDERHPMDFAAFCKNYYVDEEFRLFFQQLHMFIHFLGRDEPHYIRDYRGKIPMMVHALKKIEEYLKSDNLLKGLTVEDRTVVSNMDEDATKLKKLL